MIDTQETKPTGNACGYSGFTAFVRTSTGYPAEGQINVPEILFANMKPRSPRDIIGARAYMALMMKFQVDGGLGHGLHGLWRERTASPEGKEAADVSCEYYEYFRRPPNFHAREKLLPRLYRMRQQHAHYSSTRKENGAELPPAPSPQAGASTISRSEARRSGLPSAWSNEAGGGRSGTRPSAPW